MGKCRLPIGGPYSGNRSIGFNTAGENYAGIPFLLAITGLSLFIAPKKRGRRPGSKDSYKRIRRY